MQKERFQGAGYLTEMWLLGRRLLLTFVIASFLGYLLGNLIPAAFVVTAIVLFRRWVIRLGIPGLIPARRPARHSPGRAEAPPVSRPPEAT